MMGPDADSEFAFSVFCHSFRDWNYPRADLARQWAAMDGGSREPYVRATLIIRHLLSLGLDREAVRSHILGLLQDLRVKNRRPTPAAAPVEKRPADPKDPKDPKEDPDDWQDWDNWDNWEGLEGSQGSEGSEKWEDSDQGERMSRGGGSGPDLRDAQDRQDQPDPEDLVDLESVTPLDSPEDLRLLDSFQLWDFLDM